MNQESTLEEATRVWLLGFARETIKAHLDGVGDLPLREVPEEAGRLAGCFVTLKRANGSLRGCIGTFAESEPLWSCVREMALSAATRDPRFAPVSAPEFESCRVEISVLSPRVPILVEGIEPGVHGLWVTRGSARGVLLPQVATEQGWGREEFLSQTCVKAGLGQDAWRDGSVEIQSFMAEVFSELESA